MSSLSWPQLLAALLSGRELSREQTAWAMDEIMSGAATPAQIAGFIAALRAKGETPGEVAGLAAAMLRHAERVALPADVRAVDVVGTGGDRAGTVNISTMAALALAGVGVPVVKHGNRAASLTCGAADLLEALGLPLDLEPEQVAGCVAHAGIGCCTAPRLRHDATQGAAVPRQLCVLTAFHVLGELTIRAERAALAIDCGDVRMALVVAGAFVARGQSALEVRGEVGLEVDTPSAP